MSYSTVYDLLVEPVVVEAAGITLMSARACPGSLGVEDRPLVRKALAHDESVASSYERKPLRGAGTGTVESQTGSGTRIRLSPVEH